MVILQSHLLLQYPGIIFGFSTKVGPGTHPFFFNLSLSVGDDDETVKSNRKQFLKKLGISKAAYQKQVHGNKISYVDKEGFVGESDAMITDVPGIGLMVSAADCTSIYLYDFSRKVIAGVHAGWRGTKADVLEKTLLELQNNFKCSPDNMAAYIAPSITMDVYIVDEDVAVQFSEKYYIPNGNKFLLDVAGKNMDALLAFGVKPNNIQRSSLCTFKMNNLLHSYRRDGLKSGRSFGIISLKD